jgi:orotate phosphoribosyltransferase
MPRSDRTPQQAADAYGTARDLLSSGCVGFRPEDPYRFTSGRISPVYMDVRKLLFHPEQRWLVMSRAAKMVNSFAPAAAVLAGGETAGIPFAAAIAQMTGTAMVYVRKEPKEFGGKALIEGGDPAGLEAVLVEDLASEGTSKAKFVASLRAAGAVVNHSLVIFSYGGVFPSLDESMDAMGVRLHALCNWADIISACRGGSEAGQDYFPDKTVDAVDRYLASPGTWAP